MQLFPSQGISETDVAEFNPQMREEFLNVRDFIVLHYHVTEREDTPFGIIVRIWKYLKPLSIELNYLNSQDVFFKEDNDIFAENSWSQVMLGQGIMPEQYHPIVNMMSDKELENFLNGIKGSVDDLVDQLPSHQQFIDKYCKASPL